MKVLSGIERAALRALYAPTCGECARPVTLWIDCDACADGLCRCEACAKRWRGNWRKRWPAVARYWIESAVERAEAWVVRRRRSR